MHYSLWSVLILSSKICFDFITNLCWTTLPLIDNRWNCILHINNTHVLATSKCLYFLWLHFDNTEICSIGYRISTWSYVCVHVFWSFVARKTNSARREIMHFTKRHNEGHIYRTDQNQSKRESCYLLSAAWWMNSVVKMWAHEPQFKQWAALQILILILIFIFTDRTQFVWQTQDIKKLLLLMHKSDKSN